MPRAHVQQVPPENVTDLIRMGRWAEAKELASIATDALDHGPTCQLIRTLRRITDTKYQHALRLTENMRRAYLKAPKRTKRASSVPTNGREGAVQAAAAMAA
jgi:hypothetical protein